VLAFRSSERLATAFGLAVSTTMAITTMLFAAVALTRWRWPWPKVALVCGSFLLADLAFVGANAVKLVDGGWLPLLIGAAVFAILSTWSAGQRLLHDSTRRQWLPLAEFLASLARHPPHRIGGTAVFLARDTEEVPLVLLHHLKHNQVLHQTVVLLTVVTADVPVVAAGARTTTESLAMGFYRVTGRFGFMEEPDVPAILRQAAKAGIPIDLRRTTYYLGRTTLVPHGERRTKRMSALRLVLFSYLKRNDRSATLYFGIPPNRVVEVGTRVEL